MTTRKHHKRHYRGKGFFDTLKKGFKFIKDTGLASKGLNLASGIAGALGKKGIADTLASGAQTAESFGAGRRRRKKRTSKLVRYTTKSPTLRAEVMDMDNNNRLAGTGRRHRRRMHGGNFFDDLLGGIKSVAETALPIAMRVAPMLGLGHHRKGGALALAGMGHHHSPHMQNYSGENSYHMGHHRGLHKTGDYMRGCGWLSRVNKGHSKMALT